MRRTLYAVAVGFAAALLFMVQPMVARMLLPVVGGSTVVWSTALVFFQTALLCGYGLAHVLSLLSARSQAVAFLVALVAAGAAALPFAMSGRVPDWSAPELWVLGELALMVGAPFVVLAATSPLLQRWYSELDEPDASEPYRLYAASNAGSIVGLLAYPLVVEPSASLVLQSQGWAVGFGLLLLLIAACGLMSRGARTVRVTETSAASPQRAQQLWWLVCSAIPAALLVTMTASITADIAPVPLLWVVPLAVYLGSHVWVFSGRAPSPERALSAMIVVAVPYTGMIVFDLSEPWWLFAPLAVIVLGLIAVAYHGELVRTRPNPRYLTRFYLWTAAGGVLGGSFATFGGPALFDTLFELPLLLVLAVALLPLSRVLERSVPRLLVSLGVVIAVAAIAMTFGRNDPATPVACLVAAFAVLAYWMNARYGLAWLLLAAVIGLFALDAVGTERSAYGRYKITRAKTDLGEFRQLVVGRVIHGTQALDESLRALPLAYYHPLSPAGQVLKEDVAQGPLGVIGLGMGGMAAYGSAARPVTFFEIDPLVVKIARNPRYFSQLKACGSHCDVVVGDGRLTLRDVVDGKFAVVMMDAFSGDAVPTHLLTVEAFEVYKRKLKPGGVILVNGSNSFIDIISVAANAGAAAGLQAVRQDYWPREAHLHQLEVTSSNWVALSEDAEFIARLAADPRWKRVEGDVAAAWTDDWQNLFAHYRWR